MSFKLPIVIPVLVISSLLAGCASTNDRAAADSIAGGADAVASVDSTVSDDPIDADRITLVVHGMSCPLCATNVDKQLLAVDGVKDVSVDLSTGKINVALAESPRPSTRQLAAAVEKSGFTLKDIQSSR